MDKIYSRNRIKIPKINFKINSKFSYNKNENNKNVKKYIIIVMLIAIITAKFIIDAIMPILDKQCTNMAKTIATNISNEETSNAISKYKYEDICKVTKDEKGNIAMISANTVIVNEIVSDITIKIQEKLNEKENSNFKIKLGSFTGSKFLSGKGPDVNIKMSLVGNIDTKLESEFVSSGINQTLHKIYLNIKCEVSILTPFDTIEEQIENQVLLAEAVILGTTPNTYYNFEGISEKDTMEIVE